MAKTVFITGGSGGIGSALVERFRRDGHRVIFTFHSNQADARALEANFGARGFQCNVAETEQCRKLAANVLAEFGQVDVLVNNAGIMQDKSFLKMERREWDSVIDTNLKSLFDFTQAFLAGMVARKSGRIINIASVAGLKGFFGKSNYSAAKAGVVGFTRSLAVEVAAKGVTVNAIAPGMVDTKMIAAIPEKYMQSILAGIPAGRLGKPEEIAELAAFLAGDSAAYITGEVISAGGGM